MSFISYLTNIYLQIPSDHFFLKKTAFEAGLSSFERKRFFSSLIVFLNFRQTSYLNVCIDHRIRFTVVAETMKILQVTSRILVWGVSSDLRFLCLF